MCCVKVEWGQVRASDRLLVEIPGWLAREKGVNETLRGFVSWKTRKAVWFVVEGLTWGGWLPKSQVKVLEVAQ